jgi:hypothetical protein
MRRLPTKINRTPRIVAVMYAGASDKTLASFDRARIMPTIPPGLDCGIGAPSGDAPIFLQVQSLPSRER